MNLHALARTYLQAGGYQIRREADGFLDLTHPESLSDVTRRVSTFRQAIGTAPLVADSIFNRYLALQMQRDARLRSFVHALRGVDLGRENVTAALKILAP